MITFKLSLLVSALFALFLLACPLSLFAAGTTFNVKDFGAAGDGRTDDTKAFQSAIDAAMKAGPGNTVLIPAGTFLIASGPLDIQHSHGLTLTGAGVNATMIWYTRADAHLANVWHNVDFTIENLSSDCQMLPNGEYDLGETQGTVTSIDASAKKITVQIENGYPLLNRSDMQNAPTSNGWSSPLYTLSDPNRADFDGNQPKMLNIAPGPDGRTATITLDNIPYPLYVGEQWMVWRGPGPIWIDLGYGDDGTTTLRNLHFYGGADNYAMGDVSGSGKLIFDHLYCGPPAYQPDRMLTCDEGWQGGGRYSFTVTDSEFLKTWDDVFDFGSDDTAALSQPAANQVIVQGTNDYRNGDLTEFADDTDTLKGSYDKAAIVSTSQVNGNTLIDLSQTVTLRNPGKDRFCDVSRAGPITAVNSTFQCANERHVYWRSGVGVSVTNCKFINVPLVMGGWDASEVPGDVTNVNVTGSTFINSVGLIVWANGGADNTPCGSNVVISGNHFYSSGRIAPSGDTDSYYGESQPLFISNATDVAITNNTFDDNWGVNTALRYDKNVTVSGNVYRHPNEIDPVWASRKPDDESVIWMDDVENPQVSANTVIGPGPYTRALIEQESDDANVVDMSAGITDPESPTLSAETSFGAVTLGWTPMPGITSYDVARASSPAGPYTTIASNVTTQDYLDSTAPAKKSAYYVVSAAGRQSNVAWIAPNADYVPVNLEASYMVAGINPAGWTYPGSAEVDAPWSSPGNSSRLVQWHGSMFSLGNSRHDKVICDRGQRIMLPAGTYRQLVMLGNGVGGADSSQNLRVTITYADGSWTTLPLFVTDRIVNPQMPGSSGIYVYVFALDPAKAAGWLTLPNTGTFRVYAADLIGGDHSTLPIGHALLPGQYLTSPDGLHILLQRPDGDLVLYDGGDPLHEGSLIWESGYTSANGPCFTVMQDDGNLVTYSGSPGATPHTSEYALWSTGTNDHGVTGLQLTDAPQIEITNATSNIWQKP